MRVLIISSKYPPEYAGSGYRAHRTYKRLQKKFGVEFDVLSSSITENKSKKYTFEGVSVKQVANKLFKKEYESGFLNRARNYLNYLFEAIPVFWHLLRNHKKYDLFHIFGKVDITSAALSFAKFFKKPVIIELVNHTDKVLQDEPFFVRLFVKRGFPEKSVIICISKYLEEQCKRLGYSGNQLWCRANPIDESKFQYFEPEIKEKIQILHMATFIPRKKQDFIVEVMKELPDKFELLLAGPLVTEGAQAEQYQEYYRNIVKRVGELKLGERIVIQPGFVDSPNELMKKCRLFVLPSVNEGLGTAVLESLAIGRPCVTNDIPGVFDQWVKNGENGFVCELDVNKWSECLQKATAIPPEKMKTESAKIIAAASTEVIDKKYYEILKELT